MSSGNRMLEYAEEAAAGNPLEVLIGDAAAVIRDADKYLARRHRLESADVHVEPVTTVIGNLLEMCNDREGVLGIDAERRIALARELLDEDHQSQNYLPSERLRVLTHSASHLLRIMYAPPAAAVERPVLSAERHAAEAITIQAPIRPVSTTSSLAAPRLSRSSSR
ncbi:hypothetical protein [Streptomyces noursei]|uniref:hypothetical protein n=1 Tax=Streptomyces noursei TaxID=1971 RepID=UPI003805B8B0